MPRVRGVKKITRGPVGVKKITRGPKKSPVKKTEVDIDAAIKKIPRQKATAASRKTTGSKKTADKPVRVVKTKGGDYPVYKKKSASAGSFRQAFRAARNSGQKIFTWRGRKYTSKVKGE